MDILFYGVQTIQHLTLIEVARSCGGVYVFVFVCRGKEFAALFDALTHSSQALSHKKLRKVAIDYLSHAAWRQFITCSIWTYCRTRWVREINTAVLRAGCEARDACLRLYGEQP